MTQQQKITMVKTLVANDEEATDSVVSVYLQLAGDAILQRLYPLGLPEVPVIPQKYDVLECKLATRYFLRRGTEGETLHIEAGVHRDYDSTTDDELLAEVTPYAKVV